jgi:hypothetical protein
MLHWHIGIECISNVQESPRKSKEIQDNPRRAKSYPQQNLTSFLPQTPHEHQANGRGSGPNFAIAK